MTEKFGMGAMGLGPLPGMAETMDFVKRAWSSFSLPSSMTPTLDVEEIDKRIADLKTVEQWLSLNLNMLQSAIQGLEIQRSTLAALKAFGEAVGTPGGLDAGAAVAKAMAAMAATVPAQASGSAAGSAGAGDDRSERRDQGAQPADRRPAAAGDTGATGGAPAGMPFTGGTTAAINPAAWWDLLQSQFSQVAQAALAGASGGLGGTGANAAAREAPEERARPSPARTAKQPRKPAARKAGARARKPAG